MQDAHALLVTFLAYLDEFVARALKPGRHHLPVLVPNRAETVPHPRVAQHGPVLDKLANSEAVEQLISHQNSPMSCPRRRASSTHRLVCWLLNRPPELVPAGAGADDDDLATLRGGETILGGWTAALRSWP